MTGEAPAPTFAAEAKPSKPAVRERIPVIRTIAEKTRQRRERKAERDARPKIPEAQLQQIKKDRERFVQPAINITEDKRFRAMVDAEKAKMAAAKGAIMPELNGGQAPPLSPGEIAQAQESAYEQFRKQYNDSAEQYAAQGVHFAENPDGTYSIAPREDVFYRSVLKAADEARITQGEEAAQAIFDQFADRYPVKAKLYSTHGEDRLKQSLARGTTTPDARAPVAGQPRASEAAPVTVNFAEQKARETKAELTRMSELAQRGENSLRAKELNELKQLRLKHATGISEARRLDKMLRVPNGPPLGDEELAKLELYEDYLRAQDADKTVATQQAVASGALPAVDTTQQIQKELAIRTLGKEAIAKLQACGIDFVTMGENQVQERLRDGLIKDPITGNVWDKNNPDTIVYIHEAFVEQQKQQAEAAASRISQADIDSLVPGKNLTKADIFQIIAMLMATGALGVGRDALTATKTN